MICYWGTICTPLYKSLFQRAKIQDPKKIEIPYIFRQKNCEIPYMIHGKNCEIPTKVVFLRLK